MKIEIKLYSCKNLFSFQFQPNNVTSFVDLKTFTLIEGEKMKCKVIFRLFEMRGEVTEYFFSELSVNLLFCKNKNNCFLSEST